jgi:4,5-DOPA dioxygenase extradiol
VLIASAHWETTDPTASTAVRPETIHDFGGFPRALYEIQYPAPGAPDLASEAARLLTDSGLEAGTDPRRGLDHGAWVPMMLLYPEADIPVAQLSIQPHRDPAHHRRVGEALRPLRDQGVLILGSGSFTHNLRELRRIGAETETPDWVVRFVDWMARATEENHVDDLLHYRDRAPEARRNHPTDEHLLPLFVASGAGDPGRGGRHVHSSNTYGSLAMDAFAFD